MADNPNIGYAALQIIPSFQGAEASLAKGIAGPSEKVASSAASSFAGTFTMALGAAGIGVGIAGAIGVGLFKLGDSFDAQFDKIRVSTGQTGEELAGLKGDFKDVLKSVPTDFDSAGTAISGIAQKLDLVGKPLQDRAEQFLELSRITGTDLSTNLGAGTDALKAWGIEAKDQGSVLDELFRASQQSGASFSDLAGGLAENSVVFKALGFNVDQASTVLAGLAKGGLDASTVMPALGKAVAAGAKDGKSAKDVYQGLIRSIKEAPDATKAASLAYDVLGAKAGPKFAALVRSGKFAFDDLGDAIIDGTDTIAKAGKDTQDFGEKFDLLKNRVLVGLEPLASGVFDAVGSGMDALGPVFDGITSGISRVVSVFQTDGIEGLGDLIQTQAPILGQKLLDLGTKLYLWVQPQIEPLLGKAGELIGTLVTWLGETGLPYLVEGAKVLASALSDWLLGKDGKTGALKALLDKAPGFLNGFVTWIDNDMTPALEKGGKRAGAALAKGIVEGTQSNLKKLLGISAIEVKKLFPGWGGADDPDPLRIPGKAGGGPVLGRHLYLVGEHGPELFSPNGDGQIVPNNQLRLVPGGGAGGDAPRGWRSGGVHLTVIERPGEDQATTAMRELRWLDQVEIMAASRG